MLHYETIPVTPFQQNCSVVWEDAGMTAAIIDPGGDLDMLQSACKQLGVTLVQIWIDGLQEAAAGYGFPPSRAFMPSRWLGDDTVFIPGHGPESTFGR